MASIIGLDIGDKRVGVAIAQEGAIVARPYVTYNRAQGEAEREILKLLHLESVSLIIAGLPLNQSDEMTLQGERTVNFCERLKKRSKVGIIYEDEYLSSREAQEVLGASGRGRRRKAEIDQISAAIILQRYLDRQER